MLEGGKQLKCKVNFPCILCKDDHLTHLFPRMEDASSSIAQGPVLKRLGHNPNAQAIQNYLVFEDLSQTPCAMSAFEVL